MQRRQTIGATGYGEVAGGEDVAGEAPQQVGEGVVFGRNVKWTFSELLRAKGESSQTPSCASRRSDTGQTLFLRHF